MRVLKSFWFISVLILVLLYTLFGFFGVPYLAKNVLPEKLEKSTKLNLSIQKAKFNPFTFQANILDLKLLDAEKKPLFSSKDISTKLNIGEIFKKNISFENIILNSPILNAKIDEKGRLNLVSRLPKTKNNDKNKTKSDWNFEINTLHIKNANINFQAKNSKNPIDISLKPLFFQAKNISTKKDKISSQLLNTSAKNIKKIDYNGTMILNPLHVKGALRVEDLDINAFIDYGLGKKGVYPKDSNVFIDLNYELFLKDGFLKLTFSDVDVSFLNTKLFYEKDKISSLKKLDLKGFEFNFDTKAKEFKINKGALHLNDVNIKKTSLMNLNGDIKTFDIPNITLTYNLNGALKTNIKNMDFTNANVSFKNHKSSLQNFNLKDFSFFLKDKLFNLIIKNVDLKDLAYSDKNSSDVKLKLAKINNISLAKNSLNIDDLNVSSGDIKYILTTNDTTNEQNSTSDFKFLLKSFNLSNSKLDFTHADKFSQKISNINASVKNISNELNESIKFKLSANENSLLSLKADGNILPKPLDFNTNFDINFKKMNLINPYIKDFITLKLKKGEFTTKGELKFSNDTININANSSINELNIEDKNEKEFFTLKSIELKNAVFDSKENSLSIKNIELKNPNLNISISKNSKTSLENILAENDKKSKKSDKKFNFFLKDFIIKNGSLYLQDNNLLNPSQTKLKKINATLSSFYLNKTKLAKLKLNANINGTGFLSIDGKFVPKDIKINSDIKADIKNLGIKTLNSYTQKFLGYNTKKGTFSTHITQNINKGKLKGNSDTVIGNFELGSRVKSKDALKVPLELGLKLLSDNDGNVKLNIPISGDMNKPDFSYGGVVVSAVVRFFTGIVAAPFNIIGNVLGIDAKNLKTVDFQASSPFLEVSENAKIDSYVKIIKKQPKLKLIVKGAYDKTKDFNGSQDADFIALANQRAESIRDELINKGLSKNSIIIQKPVSVKSKRGDWIGCPMGIE